MTLPSDATERKEMPIARGVLGYFPDAVAEVAHVSFVGNQQHNPGQPMHWAKGKSTDHADCLARHLIEAGTKDTDGLRHSAKVAWRALALLQTEIEVEREKGGIAKADENMERIKECPDLDQGAVDDGFVYAEEVPLPKYDGQGSCMNVGGFRREGFDVMSMHPAFHVEKQIG